MGSLAVNESLQWVQTSPNQYERAIDDLEKFYIFIDNVGASEVCEHWAVSAGIKIDTPASDLVPRLKSAWTSLRYDHPTLASQVIDGRWVYTLGDEQELEGWLEETFIVHPVHLTAKQVYSTTPRPLKRVRLHVIPTTQEILLQSTHFHLDGRGVLTVFNNLLQKIAAAPTLTTFGNETQNLLPALTIAASIPNPYDKERTRWHTELGQWIQKQPTVRLGAVNLSQAPGASRMQSLTFSALSTSLIVQTAKQNGLTPTAVAQAALALAARKHGSSSEKDSMATLALYDVREYVDHLPGETLVGPHVAALPIVLPLDDFLPTAKTAQELFVTGKQNRYALHVSPLFSDAFPRLLSAPVPVPSSNAQLSSMGRLDHMLGERYGADISVRDFWITLDMATPDTVVLMWTFQGQLTFAVGFNEVFHDYASMRWLLALVKEEIEAGLTLELEAELRGCE